MPEVPGNIHFNSDDEMMAFLKSRLDDIQNVVIPVAETMQFTGPGAPPVLHKNVGAVIRMVSGQSFVLGRKDAEMLINDVCCSVSRFAA